MNAINCIAPTFRKWRFLRSQPKFTEIIPLKKMVVAISIRGKCSVSPTIAFAIGPDKINNNRATKPLTTIESVNAVFLNSSVISFLWMSAEPIPASEIL